MNAQEAIAALRISYHSHDPDCPGEDRDNDRDCSCGADEANARINSVCEWLQQSYQCKAIEENIIKILEMLREQEQAKRNEYYIRTGHNT